MTLVITVVLLLAITVIVFYTARTNLMEQRIASNDYRSKQAFEAAEAGLEYAIGRLSTRSPVELIAASAFSDAGLECNPASEPITGTCRSATPLTENGATFSIELEALNDFKEIEITSFGFSADRSSSREVKVLVSWIPLVGNRPRYPLIVKNDVELKNSALVETPSAQKCIAYGNDAILPPATTNCDPPGDSWPILKDVDFFKSFFLISKERVRPRSKLANRTSNGSTDYSSALNTNAETRVFWIDGEGDNVNINNSTLGSAPEPVVLIVENFSGLSMENMSINGLVYIAGPWDNGLASTINGAVLAEEDIVLDGAKIFFDNDVIENLTYIGAYSRVPGSWRDF